MRVLVGTEEGLHDVGGGVEFPGRTVTALAREGSAWWSIVDGRAIWRSAGGSWEEVAEGGDLARNCLLPTEAGLFVGTAEAHLLRLARGGLEAVPGFDEVEGRDAWYTPWGGPPDTRSLAVDRNGTLYANVHVGGIARSADGGLTWKRTIDIDTDVHQVLAHPTTPGLVLAATGDAGLAVSANGGDWWDFQTEGLHANYSRAVAVAGDAVLVTASESHLGRNAAVYRRPLSGGLFERCAVRHGGRIGVRIERRRRDVGDGRHQPATRHLRDARARVTRSPTSSARRWAVARWPAWIRTRTN
ncbi:MAG: hypothetical protein HYU54_05680 [Actinobacteria bacterium]|nr:hypothetical protein [Actinomycetota bacterium]